MRLAHVSLGKVYGGMPELIRAESGVLRDAGCAIHWFDLAPYFEDELLADFLHDAMHGMRPRVAAEPLDSLRRRFVSVGARAAALVEEIKAVGPDVVVLHDPVALSLAPALAGAAMLVWRSHVGDSVWTEWTAVACQILAPALERCAAAVVHLPAYVWPEPPCRFLVSSPGINVDSPKNRDLTPDEVERMSAVLTSGSACPSQDSGLSQADRPLLDDQGTGLLPSAETRYVTVVARWDPLKGHLFAMDGLVDHAATDIEVHYVLYGPRLAPESRVSFHEIQDSLRSKIRALPRQMGRRFHIWSSIDPTSRDQQLLLNLIRTRSAYLVQPSLREGFGLSVTEGMYRRRPVLASAVGGHPHQIESGRSGLLFDHTREAFLNGLQRAAEAGPEMGDHAREKVLEEFTAYRSAKRQYEFFLELIDRPH